MKFETAVLDQFVELKPFVLDALNYLNNGQIESALDVLKPQKNSIQAFKRDLLKKDEKVLNELYVLNAFIDFLIKYFHIWELIKKNKCADSWVALQHAINLFRFLKRHDVTKSLSFFENQLIELERLYPYNVFFSMGAIVEHFECSICGKDIDTTDCNHIKGELYYGEMAIAIGKNITQIDHISIVSNPADKCCVVKYEDDAEQFKLIRFLSELLSSQHCKPLDFGKLKFSKKIIQNPNYKKIGRNAECFCGSGKKFKMCCIESEIIESDHVDIIATPTDVNAVIIY